MSHRPRISTLAPRAVRLATLLGLALALFPVDAEARLCRGEAEVTCKDRPECQWLARERRDPKAQARAEAAPEFHCVPRPASGDSVLDRQQRPHRRIRDRETRATVPERSEGEAKRPVRDRIERDRPKQQSGRERVERASDVERPSREPNARRGGMSDAEKEAKRAQARARREERLKKREASRAKQREQSSEAREALRKKRESASREAKRKRQAKQREREARDARDR